MPADHRAPRHLNVTLYAGNGLTNPAILEPTRQKRSRKHGEQSHSHAKEYYCWCLPRRGNTRRITGAGNRDAACPASLAFLTDALTSESLLLVLVYDCRHTQPRLKARRTTRYTRAHCFVTKDNNRHQRAVAAAERPTQLT